MAWNVERGAIFTHSEPFARTIAAIQPDVILLEELTSKNSAAQVKEFLQKTLPASEGKSWNVVFGAGLKARFKGVSGFLAVDNLFDARYETFGTFAVNPRAAGAPVERFLTPAPPVHLTGGLSYEF